MLVVDAPALVRRQAVPLGPGAKRALAVLAAMVLLLATGAVPAAVAGLLAASAIVLLGLMTTEQAFRSVSWTTVVLVGGMISLSTAMVESGAAADLADALVDLVARPVRAAARPLPAHRRPRPGDQQHGHGADRDPDRALRRRRHGRLGQAGPDGGGRVGRRRFLTPVATPANLMVMGPGGYRFGDYWKLGLPLLALFGVVAVLLVPLIWTL